MNHIESPDQQEQARADRHPLYYALLSQPGVVEQVLPSAEKTLDRYADSRSLDDNTAILSTADLEPLATAEDEANGVRQSFYAMVRAGTTLFGIVRVGSHRNHGHGESSWYDRLALIRLDRQYGKEPTLVGLLDDELHIGRETEAPYDLALSRQHFSIQGLTGGRDNIRICDTDSKNMTRVLARPRHLAEQVPPSGSKNVVLGALRRQLHRRRTEVVNPLEHDLNWALEPDTIKTAIDASIQKTHRVITSQ